MDWFFYGCLAAIFVAQGIHWRLNRNRRRRIGRLRAGQCVACGYDLTGNPSRRCPECGRVAGVAVPTPHGRLVRIRPADEDDQCPPV